MKPPTTALRMTILALLTTSALGLWWNRYTESLPPKTIEDVLRQQNIPGAILGIRIENGPIHIRAIGNTTTTRKSLATNTRFPIASLSKPITSAAIRQLIQQGKLSLETPVFGLLPEATHADDARYRQITVRHLLQHTAGFDQTSGDPMVVNGTPVSCDVAIATTLNRPLESNPGTHMRYSNTGYCLLGKIVERTTGQEYERAVYSLLSLSNDSPVTLGPPNNGIEPEGDVLPADLYKQFGAAGGWFSDAESLLEQFSKDIRDSQIAATPTTPYENWYYGLGWRVWPTKDGSYHLTHFGSLPGMFSVAVGYPDGSTAVLLMNGRPTDGESTAEHLHGLLIETLQKPELMN